MSDKDEIVIFKEEYKDNETGEVVDGAGVVIDGKLKGVMDRILKNHPKLGGYNELVREAVYRGIVEIIRYGLRE